MKNQLRWADGIGLLFALLGYAFYLWKHRRFFHDDAYISLRYARNFADHFELNWNLGERVEGYTNFLHTVAAGGLLRLGVGPEDAVRALNVAGALLMIFAVIRIVQNVLPGDENAVPRGILIATAGLTPSIALWTLGGLEAVAVAGFFGAGLAILVSENGLNLKLSTLVAAGIAFALAILTRMDSAIAITGIGLGLLFGAKQGYWRGFWAAFVVVGIPAAVAFIHMAVRYSYYGELLPLTFYAKTGLAFADRIQLLPVFLGLSVTWVPVFWFALVALVAAAYLGKRDLTFWLAAGPLGMVCAYLVWVGGDHMPGARFVVPLVPFSILAIAAAIPVFQTKTRVAVAAPVVILTGILGVSQPAESIDNAAYYGRIAAERVNQVFEPGSLVAVHTAGSTPFFAESMNFIDMLGLVDRTIAHRKDVPMHPAAPYQRLPGHAKGDGAYVLSRAPDYIIPGPALGTRLITPWFLTDVELTQIPEFKECYEMVIDVALTPEFLLWRNPTEDEWFHEFIYFRRTCA